MKFFSFTLICFLLICACNSEQGCDPPLCPQPNINDQIQLTLRFSDLAADDSINVVRVTRGNQQVIDTIQIYLSDQKAIQIGSGGIVGFTEPTTGKAFEEATLDFIVFYKDQLRSYISDIQIERTIAECSCAEYIISTLILNEKTLEVNASDFLIDF